VATIRVHLPGDSLPDGTRSDRSYDITCGAGLLGTVGGRVAEAGGRRAVVIADSAVASTHAAAVAESIREQGLECSQLEVSSGETSKSLAQAGALWAELARQAVDRATHIVAVGGGVVGDLAGFVAASFARGLPLWHVPTTLVAQVDSAIGGKTGINLAEGKNLVGAFWQPRGVVADIDSLATLPDREFRSGLAEVVKYGMILDADFFEWLEATADRVLAREPAAVTTAVERSAALKAQVVEQDEREISGLRAALNYGHTFGHAYETAGGYGALLHGEAVALGMGRAARLAALMGRLDPGIVPRQDRLLARFGLPTSPRVERAPGSPEELLAIMARDKKALGGHLRFVLPDRIGRFELVAGIDPDLVRRVLMAD
jgi:3-dehydroquinate synthase